ncbi:Pleckstrin homology domain-containing family A member 5 [Plecturocebus cupreus]
MKENEPIITMVHTMIENSALRPQLYQQEDLYGNVCIFFLGEHPRNYVGNNFLKIAQIRLNPGQARWLMPIVPAICEASAQKFESSLGSKARPCVYKYKKHFGRLRLRDHLRSGVRDQPGQHGKTPSLLKIQKLAGQGSLSVTQVECSVTISAHCNFRLPGSSDYCVSDTQKLVESGLCHVSQAGLNLLTSGGPPILASQSAGITGMSHQAQPHLFLFNTFHLCNLSLAKLSRLCEQDKVVHALEEKLQQLHKEKYTLEQALLSASQEIEMHADNPAAIQTVVLQRDDLQNGLLSTCRELSRATAEHKIKDKLYFCNYWAFCYLFIYETRSHSVTQDGVQWFNHNSLVA